jgi:hypothetical protein
MQAPVLPEGPYLAFQPRRGVFFFQPVWVRLAEVIDRRPRVRGLTAERCEGARLVGVSMIRGVRGRFWRWWRGRSAGWELVSDRVFSYRAPNGFDGVCHLRVFESGARRERPVVIVGELSDQAGACSIVNADDWIAAQVQDTFFGDGRRFVYVEHHPETITGVPEPTFAVVQLERSRTPGKRARAKRARESTSAGASVQQQLVVVTEEGAESHAVPKAAAAPAWGWTFRALRREALTVHPLGRGRVGLDVLPGVQVRVWPVEGYTAYAVAGEEGALPSVRAAERNRERIAKLTGAVDAVTGAPPEAILDITTDVPAEDPPDPGG